MRVEENATKVKVAMIKTMRIITGFLLPWDTFIGLPDRNPIFRLPKHAKMANKMIQTKKNARMKQPAKSKP